MNEEQFELLMKEITGIKKDIAILKEGQRKLEERQIKLEEGQKKLQENIAKEIMESRLSIAQEFREVRNEVRKVGEIYARQKLETQDLIERRYQESLDDRKSIHEDINVLHILSKKNDEDHKEYEKILQMKSQ